MHKNTAACSWSSGKDSCLACFKAKEQGYDIRYLMNFVSEEFQRVSFHGVQRSLVQKQAEAAGIALVQREVGKNNYEEVFRATLQELKKKNITTLVAGDIFLLDCRNWVIDISQKEGLSVIEPLWEKKSVEILREFINVGFQAVVTAVNLKKLSPEWVGRNIDDSFIKDIASVSGVDPCGENGEYHTFVHSGPLFSKKIDISIHQKVTRDDYCFLDIRIKE